MDGQGLEWQPNDPSHCLAFEDSTGRQITLPSTPFYRSLYINLANK